MDQKTRFFQMIRRILLLVDCNSTNGRENSTDSRPKWLKNTLTKDEEHCIIDCVLNNHTEPGFSAVTGSGKVKMMFLFNYVLNFYRIEVFLNSDKTMDAFLYWRIPEDSSFRSKNYGGSDNDRWDLIAAKLDLLSDGLTCRELFRLISQCSDHNPHVIDHLKFTYICECPALEDVQYNDYVDSYKVMDIFFNDGCASKIRSVLDVEQINNSDIVATFAFS